MPVAHLEDRAVIAVTGPEARPFLQGLITNDIERLEPGKGVYAALLTPQGKILFDFFLVLLTIVIGLGTLIWIRFRRFPPIFAVYDQKLASTVLLIPRWPFQLMAEIGILAFCLAILADLLLAIARAAGRELDLHEGGKVKLAAD